MEKEKVYILIQSEEQLKKVHDLLKEAGEKIGGDNWSNVGNIKQNMTIVFYSEHEQAWQWISSDPPLVQNFLREKKVSIEQLSKNLKK